MTALISTIASTTTEPSQSSLEAAAENACIALVKHYSDPIHHHTSDGTECPYFHDERSSLPRLPPVCEFWYRKLVGVGDNKFCCDESDRKVSLAIIRELLCCYETIIRSVLFDSTTSMHSVMKVIEHYELFLAHFVRNATEDTTTATSSIDGVMKSLDKVHIGNGQDESSNDELLRFGRIIYCISQDISNWLSKSIHDNDQSETKGSNGDVYPYLLRLLGYCVTLLSSTDVDNISDSTIFKEALSIATVTCVPFVGDGKTKSGNFGIGTLVDWILESASDVTTYNPISVAAALKCCFPSPFSVMDDSDLMPSSTFMGRPVIDWSVRSAQFEAPWSDEVSFRAAEEVLKRIYRVSIIISPAKVELCEDVDGNASVNILPCLQSISRSVGIEVLTATVRAFFYARLSFPSTSTPNILDASSKPLGPYLPMVRRIGSEKRESEKQAPDMTREHNKFRVSSATLILCAVLSQHSCFKACDNALLDAIPIALTLLDDVQAFHQGLGATIVSSAIASLSSFGSTSRIPSFVAKFNQFLIAAFDTAIKHCGREDAPLITSICFAQSRWIQYLSSISQHPDCIVSREDVNALARKAATDMMNRVINQTHFGGKDGNDERIAGIIVAGVNPLLALLANLPEAPSIEIARTGLSALLPLIGWRGSSLESHALHLSSMACLLSLMNGAFPIMTKHGGKILTEIILLLDRNDKDTEYLAENNSTFPLGSDNHIAATVTVNVALYSGAVSLIVCGESAEAVIQHVKSTNLHKPVDRCQEIFDLSKKIRP